jgi:hypothetical protein
MPCFTCLVVALLGFGAGYFIRPYVDKDIVHIKAGGKNRKATVIRLVKKS